MWKKLKQKWDFKWASFKLNRAYKNKIKFTIKTLKFYIYTMNKIGIPTNKSENEILKMFLASYDKMIESLNQDINRYRNYIWK